MKEYYFAEARQNFAKLLEESKKDGVVCIRQDNGELFYLKPEIPKKSPLDIEGVCLDLTVKEIVNFVWEGREQG